MTTLSIVRLEDEAQRDALDRRGAFTTMTREGTDRWAASQVALLLSDDDGGATLVGVGTATRSHRRVATGWYRLGYLRRAEIQPVPASALLSAIPKRFRAAVADRLRYGGRLPDKIRAPRSPWQPSRA